MKKFDGEYNSNGIVENFMEKMEAKRKQQADDGEINAQDTAQEKKAVTRVKTTMLSRNINVLGHRTSIRLEKEMWESLKSIATREGCSVHDICSLIQVCKRQNSSLTAAIRVFIMLYYKAAATEEGHRAAGHGNFENMKRRAGFTGDFSAFKKSKAEEIVSNDGQSKGAEDNNDISSSMDYALTEIGKEDEAEFEDSVSESDIGGL